MRLAVAGLISVALCAGGCASTLATGGTLGEGELPAPRITAIDTGVPPRLATIDLPQAGHVALILVAPGHSATLLYPADSLTSNRLDAGSHRLGFEIPQTLVETDSQRLARMREMQRTGPRRRGQPIGGGVGLGPIPVSTPAFLLLLTSPQELDYVRMIEKTGGVSIPTMEAEALNAVAKAIKSTLPAEPRDWAGHYEPVVLRRVR